MPHVGGALHEADRDIVDLLIQREVQILQILVGQRADIQRPSGQVYPLVGGQRPAIEKLQLGGFAIRRNHLGGDCAVIEKNGVSRLQRREEFGMRHGQGLAPGGLAQRQRALFHCANFDVPVQIPQPQLRSLKVGQDRDMRAQALCGLPDAGNGLGVRLVIAVAHIHAEGVRAMLDQLRDDLCAAGGGAQRRQYLARAAGLVVDHQTLSVSRRRSPISRREDRRAKRGGVQGRARYAAF